MTANVRVEQSAGDDTVSDARPFRGGDRPDAPTSDAPAATPTSSTPWLQVSARNYELLRRLDANRDGVIEATEAQQAMARAGTTRIRNEASELNDTERRAILHMVTSGRGSVGLVDQRSGEAIRSADDWRTTRQGIYRAQAGQRTPVTRMGQGRPSANRNNDCGPTCALFMHHRRMGSSATSRTHAQLDRTVDRLTSLSGTTPPQMKGIMNQHHRHAGGRYYSYDVHTVTPENLQSEIQRGLLSDPGGVMVPIVSTYNQADRTGTPHWIVVTAIEGNTVQYYDPGGPDGANHMRTMPLSELQGSLRQADGLFPNQIVYGTSIPESSATGQLAAGRQIGGVSNWNGTEPLGVRGSHGIYGRQADARAAAQRVAQNSDKDAIVRREGTGWAVYSIDEIRDRFGGLWSSNRLTGLDRNITDVYMTDPVDDETVRRARSGPPE